MTRGSFRLSVLITAVVALAALSPACDDGGEGAAAGPPSAMAIVEYLQASGFPIGDVVAFTEETDPNGLLGQPGAYIEKVTFKDARLQDQGLRLESGGTVEVFRREQDARERQRYLRTSSAGISLATEYSEVAGPVLLRLSRGLAPEAAEAYFDALEAFLER
jgi:hypothetical protein